MWSPSLLHISYRIYLTQTKFAPLNDHMIAEFPWVVTMVTGCAQHWHLAVTCNVTVAIVKTIVIAAYLPYQITQINLRAL